MEAQGKLFEIAPIRIPRPTSRTVNYYEVFLEIAEELSEWNEEELNEKELQELANDLQEEMGHTTFMYENGYKICKDLESEFGYSPDDELVEIMGGTYNYFNDALKKVIKKWVIDCWIKPTLNIGDKAEINYKEKKYEAEIVKIVEEEARYIFHIPEVFTNKESGVYIDFEDVDKDFFKNKTE